MTTSDQDWHEDSDQIVVKFRSELAGAIAGPDTTAAVRELDAGALRGLCDDFDDPVFRPAFEGQRAASLRRVVQRGRLHDPGYNPPDFRTYVTVDSPSGGAETLAQALVERDQVEFAYVDTVSPEPPAPPCLPLTRAYRSAERGIDVEGVADVEGATGVSQRLLIVEGGWAEQHDALGDVVAAVRASPTQRIQSHRYNDPDPVWRAHGTEVLGLIAAQAWNGLTGGIAPDALVHVFGLRRAQGYAASPLGAITAALNIARAGDILLIQAQVPRVVAAGTAPPATLLPVEVAPLTFDVIKAATAAGITVIEPAANGDFDFDALPAIDTRYPLTPKAAGHTDSGAIVVAAATGTPAHRRRSDSCFGNRVDCHALGEDVATCSLLANGSSHYNCDFGMTSAAATIVAGAALAMQGIATARLRRRLTAVEMRALLRTLGTSVPGEKIGVMPDLTRIAGAI